MRRATLIDDYFNEHIVMPGFPQIIVTRGWLWGWLKSCGWNPRERGVGSMDYIVGAARATKEETTANEERDRLLNQVRAGFLRNHEQQRSSE